MRLKSGMNLYHHLNSRVTYSPHFTPFSKGLLNMIYFGLSSTSNLPNTISIVEVPYSPFSCISILKDNTRDEKAYEIF